MTVNTSIIVSGPYAGNDIADEFNYEWRVSDKTQVKVIEADDATGVETILTVDTDYTVSGINVEGGGSVTRVAGALASGTTWYVVSDFDYTQTTDFANQGGFFPAVHESAVDKLTMLIQQLQEEIGRSMRIPVSSEVSDLTLPAPTANNYLAWNSAGDALENSTGTGVRGDAGAAGADGLFTGAEPTVTPASGDLAAIKDVSDSDNPKFATALNIAQLLLGNTGELSVGFTTTVEDLGSDTVTPNFANQYLKARTCVGNVDIEAASTIGACDILFTPGASDRTVTAGSNVTILDGFDTMTSGTNYIASVRSFDGTTTIVEFKAVA